MYTKFFAKSVAIFCEVVYYEDNKGRHQCRELKEGKDSEIEDRLQEMIRKEW